MKRIIIFDFNRTIYDPDSQRLVPYTRLVLRILLRRGFVLYLVSRAGRSRRQLIERLGITQYFNLIIITRAKGRKDFEKLVARQSIIRSSSFVIGDRVRKEIRIGNSLNMKTVWLRNGKFSNELPRNAREQPTYFVRELREIVRIVR